MPSKLGNRAGILKRSVVASDCSGKVLSLVGFSYQFCGSAFDSGFPKLQIRREPVRAGVPCTESSASTLASCDVVIPFIRCQFLLLELLA